VSRAGGGGGAGPVRTAFSVTRAWKTTCSCPVSGGQLTKTVSVCSRPAEEKTSDR
jgi:hypothetical protein